MDLKSTLNPLARVSLKKADTLITKGRGYYDAALSQLTTAINISDVAATRYRRGELLFHMRLFTKAIEDLESAVSHNPKHVKAYKFLIKAYAHMGNLLSAAKAATRAAAFSRETAAKKLRADADQMSKLGRKWETAKKQLERLRSDTAMSKRQIVYGACANILKQIISEYAVDNIELRLRYAEYLLLSAHPFDANDELKVVLARNAKNPDAAALAARVLHALGATTKARTEIRHCLQIDPEHSSCSQLHKKLKRFEILFKHAQMASEGKQWQKLSQTTEELLNMVENEPTTEDFQFKIWRCQALVELREMSPAEELCEIYYREIEENDPKHPLLFDFSLLRADLYILDERLDSAERMVKHAETLRKGDQKISEYRQKLARLQTSANRKNYYRILEVKKGANEKDIKRAYRKKAMEFHPDQLRSKTLSDKERETADKAFRDINEAKEVLSNPDLRQRYDNGEDVMNPKAQQPHAHPDGFDFGPGGFNFGGFRFQQH